jgi:hypothetical protein
MKIYCFKDKLPELGTNIVIVHESSYGRKIMIAICTFDLILRRYVLKEDDDGDYFPQDYFSDDPAERANYDIRGCDYWFYPSSIKLPKKKKRCD